MNIASDLPSDQPNEERFHLNVGCIPYLGSALVFKASDVELLGFETYTLRASHFALYSHLGTAGAHCSSCRANCGAALERPP